MFTEIETNLKILGSPITLKRSFIACYGRQVLTHSIWLIEGEIIIEQQRKINQVLSKPGLYFYEEFIEGKTVPFKIEVKAGSRILILTKSELALLGLALPA